MTRGAEHAESSDTAESPLLWAARAAVAERAVLARHLRRAWFVPGTALGVAGWPGSIGQRLFFQWNYWWQAHLMDCIVDAQLRAPAPARVAVLNRLAAGVRLRNVGSWTNAYYDDVAWLGLALLRAAQTAGVPADRALTRISERLREGWTDHGGGGIWWRSGDHFKNARSNGPAAIPLARRGHSDDFKNVPSNGPAAILLARWGRGGGERSDRQRARSMTEWMERQLRDEATGLLWDGLHVNEDGSVRGIVKTTYTYCQGVFLGACLELADGDASGVWAARAERTVDAVATHLAEAGVLPGQGAGDGGLFAGILARYLALAAVRLPQSGSTAAGVVAANLVLASAEAAWRNRAVARSGPLFGPEWSQPAVVPRSSHDPRLERDLSVQLSGWMLLEAAALLERST